MTSVSLDLLKDEMLTDELSAREIGFPKVKYALVEYERRWLCREVPRVAAEHVRAIVDRYIEGTHLRLRTVRDCSTGADQFKLTRKRDIAEGQRLVTTIYLAEHEFALFAALPARVIAKSRHRVRADGHDISVDKFGGSLTGLILAEVEFADEDAMKAFRPPVFLGEEVTKEARYAGGALAIRGAPRVHEGRP